MAKIKDSQVTLIEKLYSEGNGIREINRRTGIARSTITRLLDRLGIREIPPPATKITDEQKAEILFMYQNGFHIKDIAEKLEVDRGTVGNCLRKMGFKKRLTNEDKEIIKQRYQEGATQKKIAEELGFTTATISRYWKEWGLTVKYHDSRTIPGKKERKCEICGFWRPLEGFVLIKARGKEYYSRKCLKCKYEYAIDNYEKDVFARWAVNLNRNSKIQGAKGKIKKSDFEKYIGHWKDNICHICKCGFSEDDPKPLPIHDHNQNDWKPQLDHIIPLSQGGENTPENIAWSHRYCNGQFKKGYRIEDLIKFCETFLKHHRT